MPIDLLEIFSILSGSCKIKVTEAKTARIQKVIRGLDDPEQIGSCVRIFLSYYPEDSLIEFCLERLFVNARPDYLGGPEYDIWQREVSTLASIIKSFRVPHWDEVLRRKMQFYCPQLVLPKQ